MTLGQMQTYVAKLLGNMQTSDPMYTYIVPGAGAESTSVIYIAVNRMIRTRPDLFPEHSSISQIGPTVAGTNSLSVATDFLILSEVMSAHQATSPNWAAIRGYPVTYINPYDFDVLDKATPVGYPILYTKRAKSVYLWPTPSASYIDYLRLYGTTKQTAISDTSASFYIQPEWHDCVCNLASAIMATKMGWFETAKQLYAAVAQELGSSRSIRGEEELSQTSLVSVHGTPTRESVYEV